MLPPEITDTIGADDHENHRREKGQKSVGRIGQGASSHKPALNAAAASRSSAASHLVFGIPAPFLAGLLKVLWVRCLPDNIVYQYKEKADQINENVSPYRLKGIRKQAFYPAVPQISAKKEHELADQYPLLQFRPGETCEHVRIPPIVGDKSQMLFPSQEYRTDRISPSLLRFHNKVVYIKQDDKHKKIHIKANPY